MHTPVPPPSPPQPPSQKHAPADTENTSALANISTGCFVLGVSDDVEPDTSRVINNFVVVEHCGVLCKICNDL